MDKNVQNRPSMLDGAPSLWGREPVLILYFVGAVVTLAVTLGLDVSADSAAALLTCVELGLALLARSQVTPVAKIAPPAAPDEPVVG